LLPAWADAPALGNPPAAALALPAIQVPVADRNFKAASMRERTCSL